MRKWISYNILFLSLITSLSCLAAPQLTVLKHWRINKQPHYWRMTFDSSGPIKYHAFRLHNPERIVIDLKNTLLQTTISQAKLRSTPIKAIRTAQHRHHTLRMVLDVKYPLKYQITNSIVGLMPENQLVIDVMKGKQKAIGFESTSRKTHRNTETRETLMTPVVKLKPIRSVRDVVIMIDPGHGGKDPGATGPRGTHEKNVVLAISKYMAALINKTPGFKAYLTRSGDYYLTLRQRLAVARKHKPDMFIAIHADAYRNRSAQGASVFALSQRGATSEAARWIAEKENKSELMGGVDLSDKSHLLKSVLLDLSQIVTIRSSLKAGVGIMKQLSKVTKLHHHDVEQAAFVVLKSPDIPSLLIETGFLSNPHEEQRLRRPYYQKKIANAIDQGVFHYFYQSPPRGTWLALKKSNPNGFKATYQVSQGDTLSEIAHRFGINIKHLKHINQLGSNFIRVGQKLLIAQPSTS